MFRGIGGSSVFVALVVTSGGHTKVLIFLNVLQQIRSQELQLLSHMAS